MRLKVHPLFLLVGCVYIVLGQGVMFITYFVAIVFHESCHFFCGKLFKANAGEITLYPFGGGVKLNQLNSETREEIAIALAGPLGNFLICVIILALWWLFPIVYPFTENFYYANLFNGVLNLLPVFPLDGGRVSIAVLKKKLGTALCIKIVKIMGYVFSSIVLILGIYALWFYQNISFAVLAVFLFIATKNLHSGNIAKNLLNGFKQKKLKKQGLVKKIVIVYEDMLLFDVIKLIQDDYFYEFELITDDYVVKNRFTEKQVYDMALNNDIYLKIGDISSRLFS